MRSSPTTILATSFSPSMLSSHSDCYDLRFERLSLGELIHELRTSDWESAISHNAYAGLLEELLGLPVPTCKRSIRIAPTVRLLIAKVDGHHARNLEFATLDRVDFDFFEMRCISDHQALRAA